MASIRSNSSPSFSVVSVLIIVCFFSPAISSTLSRKVGGRREVKGVESNQEVQHLGRFAVKEYNRLHATTNGQVVIFSHVVAAETQVVAGIKYYLKIEATQHGETRVFESVVVVKPWLQSKKLLAFTSTPSPSPTLLTVWKR